MNETNVRTKRKCCAVKNVAETSDQTTQDGDGEANNEVKLKRQLGLGTTISIVVGMIIGGGIFVSPKGVAQGTGSIGLSLLVWALAAIPATFSALCLAELSAMIPRSGGIWYFFNDSLGPLVAFMYLWQRVFIMVSTHAVSSMVCANYLLSLAGDDCAGAPLFAQKAFSVFIYFTSIAVNVYSVRVSARFHVTFTVLKVSALILIIGTGIYRLATGYASTMQNVFVGSSSSAGDIVLSFYSAIYAYEGANMPLALIIGLPLVAVIYVLTNISYFTVLDVPQLIESPAVAISWAQIALPFLAWYISLGVAVSTFGSLNISVFGTSRYVYIGGREGHLPKVLSYVNVKHDTPAAAIIFVATIALIYFVLGDATMIIRFQGVASWTFNGLVDVALLILRWKRPHAKRPFRVPLVVPILDLTVSVGMVLAPLVLTPRVELLYSIGTLLLGIVVYFPMVRWRCTCPGMGWLTTKIQHLLLVSPPTKIDEDESL